MLKKKRHCNEISQAPSVATTGIQIKFQYLGEFLVQLENLQRSAPWGIAYPKGSGGGS